MALATCFSVAAEKGVKGWRQGTITLRTGDEAIITLAQQYCSRFNHLQSSLEHKTFGMLYGISYTFQCCTQKTSWRTMMQNLGTRLKYTEQYCMSNNIAPRIVNTLPFPSQVLNFSPHVWSKDCLTQRIALTYWIGGSCFPVQRYTVGVDINKGREREWKREKEHINFLQKLDD